MYALCKSGLSITRDCGYIVFSLQENRSPNAVHERGFNFDDARIMRGAWRNEPNPDVCKVKMNLLLYFVLVAVSVHFLNSILGFLLHKYDPC